MFSVLLLAVPLGLVWNILSNQLTLESFLVGYLMAVAILLLVGTYRIELRVRRLPIQLFWLGVYTMQLALDILLSGIDVALRVMSPTMRINPGIRLISTQDENKSPIISALSAHTITITPGEMVIDFRMDDECLMYVHCLDIEKSGPTLEQAQANRLRRIRRILGYDG